MGYLIATFANKSDAKYAVVLRHDIPENKYDSQLRDDAI